LLDLQVDGGARHRECAHEEGEVGDEERDSGHGEGGGGRRVVEEPAAGVGERGGVRPQLQQAGGQRRQQRRPPRERRQPRERLTQRRRRRQRRHQRHVLPEAAVQVVGHRSQPAEDGQPHVVQRQHQRPA